MKKFESFKKFENEKSELNKIKGGAPNWEQTQSVGPNGETQGDLAARCYINGHYDLDVYAKKQTFRF
ncbi:MULTISPECIES: hypothetical protein [Tenacibaculum]|uniref:hypothetical protein n=1 Tax=Tenacibaculum TaxID=104267 RepID=UPI00089A7C47|nr:MULTISPECIES: hypothetical protein [unclassified Tenacibaculum]RBW57267.1 hypothetical protein DS884_11860 [Tenacibaculum sp. E3R01]SEE24729.1 hypothetical protein SAMN04487765_1889 [Tenacibaculum sp. MAR_2010_89]